MMKLKKLNLIPTKFGLLITISSIITISIYLIYYLGRITMHLEETKFTSIKWSGMGWLSYIIFLLVLIIFDGFIIIWMLKSRRKYKLSKSKNRARKCGYETKDVNEFTLHINNN